MALRKTDTLCSCGTPFRDFDNQCLRCKKTIDPKRAENLEFHRTVAEAGNCSCSETSRESWGGRETLIEGLFLCNFCDKNLGGPVEDPKENLAKEAIARQEAAKKVLEERVNQEFQRIVSDTQNGKSVYLYRSFYVSVDSFNDFGGNISQMAPFNDSEVKMAGTRGWRAIEAIPRTAGSTLQNYEGFGKAWAGGIGGTVVGAYVLMEFVVTPQNVDASRDLILETVRHYINI